MLSKRRERLYKYLYNKSKENYVPKIYQSCGSYLLFKLFYCQKGNLLFKDDKMNEKYGEVKNIILDCEFYMKFDWFDIEYLFIYEPKNSDLSNTIGFHWFNASNDTKNHLKEITKYKIPDKFKGLIFKEKNKFYN